MPVKTLFPGPVYTVCAWLEDGRCQVEDYLKMLAKGNNSDAGAMIHLMDQTSQNGPPSNTEKFRYLKGNHVGILEFKARHGTRVLAFADQPHRRMVCTHAIPKLKERQFNREVQTAKDIKEAYFLEQKMEESGYVN